MDTAHEPGTDAFTVVADGTTIMVSNIAISDALVTLTLQSAVAEDQTVTLDYAPPMDASERLQDAAGNETAMLTDQEVTNNTPPVQPPPGNRTIKLVPGETQHVIDGVAVTVVQAVNALSGIVLILPEDVSGNLPSGNELQVAINPPDPDAPEAEGDEFSFGSTNVRTLVDISLSTPLTAPVQVCMPVSQALREETDGKPIRIYRHNGNEWQPLPDSTDLGSEVCADVDEFSLFALGFSTPPEATAPLAPSSLTATADGHDAIALSWTAPAGDPARSPVTGYRVEWSTDGGSAWTAFEPALDASATAYRDTGLKAATTRHYRVIALSAAGDSPASNTASATTDEPEATAPLAPSSLTATADGHDAIALSWTAPAEDSARSPVTGYRVEWSTDGGTAWTAFEPALDADTTAYRDTGLKAATTRHYRVIALSAAGDSPASNTASAMTEATAPLAPSSLTATADGHDAIALSWTAPAEDPARSAVTGYRVEWLADGGSAWTAFEPALDAGATTYRDTGLTAGATRHYRVIALSATGDSPASNTASATTEVSAPLAPSNLTATADGHDAIALSWTAPAGDPARSPVTGYRVEWSTDGGSAWTAFEPALDAGATTYRDTGLTAGATRHYRVIALSATGDSPASTAASAMTEVSAPLAPSNLTSTADGHDAIALSWTAPAGDPARSPVTGYRVEWSTDGESDWTAFEPALDAGATTYRDTGLKAATTRHYRVIALSATGDSPASNIASATTEALVVAWVDTDFTVTEGGTALAAVRLSAPADRPLRIPLTVTPEYGVLAGVPEAVTFAPGESRKEFAMSAPMDEDAEDAEAILGFGALPEGVLAGQPTQARVAIIDDDKAAVARFEKLNEALLGRQALLLMDDVHFAVGSRLEALATKRIYGSGPGRPSTVATSFDHGPGQPSTVATSFDHGPGQPSTMATSFGHGQYGGALASAVPQGFSSGPRVGGPSDEGGHFPGGAFSLGGQNDWTGLFAANAQALGEGRFNAAQLLGNSSFVLPLTARAEGEDDGVGGLTVWGSGNYHSLSNRAAGPSWNGEVLDALLGVDMALTPNLLAGLSLSGSAGSFDYEDPSDNASGQYESMLTGAHPYLGWVMGPMRLWGTAGFGEGEIEITETGRSVQRSDTRLRALAIGGSGELTSRKENGAHTAWNLKSEATGAEVEVYGGGLIRADTLRGTRLRMAVERQRTQALSDGSMFSSTLELGMRRDDGFDTGETADFGGELGLGVYWRKGGLTLGARGRSMISGHGKEWGANVLVRLAGNEDGKGLSFSAQPSWGETASGVERLWAQGVSDFTGTGPGHADPRGLGAEIGYGLMSSRGLVTPYGALDSHRSGQSLRYGVRWNLLSNWDLSLENARHADDNGFFLRADWGFGSSGWTGKAHRHRD